MKKEKDGADAKVKAEVKKEVKKDARKDVKGKDVAKKEPAAAGSRVKKESDKEKEVSLGASKQVAVAKATAKQEKENGVSKTTTVVKEQVEEEVKAENGKVVRKRSAATKKTTTVTKKKVFDLPGQKHEPPEERDPQRIFYETLREQIPSSEMAEFWLMEHGLLPEDEAKAAFEKKQRQKKQPSTPVKLASTKAEPKSNGTTSKQQPATTAARSKAKRERESDEDDDDFVSKPTKRRARKLEV